MSSLAIIWTQSTVITDKNVLWIYTELFKFKTASEENYDESLYIFYIFINIEVGRLLLG